MKRLLLLLSSVAAAASLSAGVPVYNPASLVPGQQYLIAGWNFNDDSAIPDSLFAVSHGAGEITSDWDVAHIVSFAGSALNAYDGDSSGGSLSLQNEANNGSHVLFRVSTTHLAEMIISYATRGTGTGFTTHRWEWSVDGQSFTLASEITGRNVTSYSVQEVDFSGAPVNDLEDVWFRVTLDGATSASGNNRIDNLQIRGTATTGVVSDGAGTATLRNAGGGDYHDMDVFERGSPQTMAVQVSGVSDDDPLRAVSITFPDTWSGLSAGNVSLSGAGFSGASVSVAGNTLTIANTELTSLQNGTATIANIVTPTDENLPGFGLFDIEVATALAGGTPTPIDRFPEGRLIVPIEMLRGVNENGVPLAIGRTVAVTGVMTVETFVVNDVRLSVYLQDETAGIAIDNPVLSNFWDWGYRGATFTAIGEVTVFRGLTQIEVPDQEHFINLGPGILPEPKTVTISQALADPEALEGTLVRMRGLELVAGEWPESGNWANLTVTDRTGLDLTFRVSQHTNLSDSNEPEWPVDAVGVFSQHAPTTNPPFVGGYQIIPREYADITPAEPIDLEGFELWQDDHFAGAGLGDPAVSGPDATPAGDGVANLVKYALDGNPWTASRDLLPQPVVEDSRLTIAFTRLRDAFDIVYSVEAGSDLGDLQEIWSSDDHPYESSETAIQQTVQDAVAITAETKRFLRLVIRLK